MMQPIIIIILAGILISMLGLAIKLRQNCTYTVKKIASYKKFSFFLLLLTLVISVANASNDNDRPDPDSGIITVQPILLPEQGYQYVGDNIYGIHDFSDEMAWRMSISEFLASNNTSTNSSKLVIA